MDPYHYNHGQQGYPQNGDQRRGYQDKNSRSSQNYYHQGNNVQWQNNGSQYSGNNQQSYAAQSHGNYYQQGGQYPQGQYHQSSQSQYYDQEQSNQYERSEDRRDQHHDSRFKKEETPKDPRRRREEESSRSRDADYQSSRWDHSSESDHRKMVNSRSPPPRHYGNKDDGGRHSTKETSPQPQAAQNQQRVQSNSTKIVIVPLNLSNVTKNQIDYALSQCDYYPVETSVSVKKDRDGTKKIYAYIDFGEDSAAEEFMQSSRSQLYLVDRRAFRAYLVDKSLREWHCASCGKLNVLPSDSCYVCEIPKVTSIELEKKGVHLIGSVPCDTLIVRDVPSECEVFDIFTAISALIPLANVIRVQMSVSRFYAFIQTNSTKSAQELMAVVDRTPLRINSRNVLVGYSSIVLDELLEQLQREAEVQSATGENAAPVQQSLTTEEWQEKKKLLDEQKKAMEEQQKALYQMQMQPQPMLPNYVNSEGCAAANAQNAMTQIAQARLILSKFKTGDSSSKTVPNGPEVIQPHPQVKLKIEPLHPVTVTVKPPVVVPQPATNIQMGVLPSNVFAAKLGQPEHKQGIIGMTPTPRGVFPKYLDPNPATFYHDKEAGYQVDPITNFYYDPVTRYYFNRESRKWCYHDPNYSTYFEVEETGNMAEKLDVAAEAAKAVVEKMKKEKEKEESIASNLKLLSNVKEMLNWEKKKDKVKVQMSLNKPKPPPTLKPSALQIPRGTGPTTINYDDEEEEEEEVEETPYKRQKMSEPVPIPVPVKKAMEMERAAAETEAMNVQTIMEKALVDEAKQMCLLCKRAFPSIDVLYKHVEQSNLHKTNLEAKRAEWRSSGAIPSDNRGGSSSTTSSQPAGIPIPRPVFRGDDDGRKYRDRAKERRQQHGINSGFDRDRRHDNDDDDNGPVRSVEQLRAESEAASHRRLDDSNVGSRLLKSMGWKEGEGIGRDGRGIVEPVRAERFVERAGMGSAGAKMTGGVEMTHQQKTRAALFSRYHAE